MKFTVEKQAFTKALSAVLSVVEKRNTIPALAHVRVSAAYDAVTLSATDLELEATAQCASSVQVGGDCLIPAHTLADIVKRVREDITFELSGSQVIIKSGRSKSKLAVLPSDQFPSPMSPEDPTVFNMHSVDLARIVGDVAICASKDDARDFLNGVLLTPNEDNNVEAVASDGVSLAVSTLPDHVAFPAVILPTKTVSEMQKLCGRADGDVTVKASGNLVRFELAGMTLTSKVLDASKFPPYARIIPQDPANSVSVAKADMSDALGIVSTVSTGLDRRVSIEVGERMALSSGDGPNTAQDEIDCTLSGDHVTLHYASTRLTPMVNGITAERMVLRYNNGASPTVIQPEGDDGLKYILMPMKG